MLYMSNHLHFIWTARENNLSDIIRDLKTYRSKSITRAIEEEPESRRDWLLYMFGFYAKRTNANDYFKAWTGNNHPEVIFSASFLHCKLNYIHQNPVKAGLVAEAAHYLYSSAVDYEGKKGLMAIDLLF